jgi:hypothetical protein
MGLGVLEDHHLQHVPGTALLADIVGDSHERQYHGTLSPHPEIPLSKPNNDQAATLQPSSTPRVVTPISFSSPNLRSLRAIP